jgi:hydrogenase maturation factor
MKNLEFTPIGERFYYNRLKGNDHVTMLVQNRFTLSYFVTEYNVYAYYMGHYYASPLVSGFDEIDIVKAILAQCSDPSKVIKEELVDDLD